MPNISSALRLTSETQHLRQTERTDGGAQTNQTHHGNCQLIRRLEPCCGLLLYVPAAAVPEPHRSTVLVGEMWAITKAMEVRDSNPDVRSTINQALMEIMEAGEKVHSPRHLTIIERFAVWQHKAMVQGTPPYEDGMGTVSAAAMHFFQAAQGPDLQGQGGRYSPR